MSAKSSSSEALVGLAFAATIIICVGIGRVIIWRGIIGRRVLVGTAWGLRVRVGRTVKHDIAWSSILEVQLQSGASFPEWEKAPDFLSAKVLVSHGPGGDGDTQVIKLGRFLVIGNRAVTQVRRLRDYCRECNIEIRSM